jgi:threonine/homoserine/homoserine lactone efflux protein
VLSLSAAIMPGPFQAFLLAQALKIGWKRTLPAALAPLITDGPIIALVLLVLTQTPQSFLDILRLCGGLFILYLARNALLTLKDAAPAVEPPSDAARQTLIRAIAINILNPNPYIFWSVVAGPIVISGWRTSAPLGISFVVGFYGVLVLALAALIVVFGTAGKIGPRTNRLLSAVAAAALCVFGLYQIVVGVTALIP